MWGTSLLYLIQELLYISWIYTQRESDINRVAQPFKKIPLHLLFLPIQVKVLGRAGGPQLTNFFPLAWEAGMR